MLPQSRTGTLKATCIVCDHAKVPLFLPPPRHQCLSPQPMTFKTSWTGCSQRQMSMTVNHPRPPYLVESVIHLIMNPTRKMTMPLKPTRAILKTKWILCAVLIFPNIRVLNSRFSIDPAPTERQLFIKRLAKHLKLNDTWVADVERFSKAGWPPQPVL